MVGFYNYSYIFRIGEICNKGYYYLTGCKVYCNSPKQVPCIDCGKLTFSDYSTCKKYSDKYRSKEFY